MGQCRMRITELCRLRITDLRRLARWDTWWMTIACSSKRWCSKVSLALSHSPSPSPPVTSSPKHSSHRTQGSGRSRDRRRRCVRSSLSCGSGKRRGFRAALRRCGAEGRGQTGLNSGAEGSRPDAAASHFTSGAFSPTPSASIFQPKYSQIKHTIQKMWAELVLMLFF